MMKKLIKKPVQVSKSFLNKEAMDRSRRIERETSTKPYQRQAGDPDWMKTGLPLVVNSETDLGPSLQAVVDEFFSLERSNTSETGDLGEKALELWTGGASLNTDSGNFPFADVVENKVTHQIYWSVKTTTTDKTPFAQSEVNLGAVWALIKNHKPINLGVSKEDNLENLSLYGKKRVLNLGLVSVRKQKAKGPPGKVGDLIRNHDYAGNVELEIKKYGPVSISVSISAKWNFNKEKNEFTHNISNPFNDESLNKTSLYGNTDLSEKIIAGIKSREKIRKIEMAKEYFGEPSKENTIRIPTKISEKDIKRRVDIRSKLQDLLLRLDNDQFEKAIKYIEDEILNNPSAPAGIIIPEIKNIILKRKKIILEKKKRRKKRSRSKCQPARRRINSGGKAGSHADPRTGGKQAYAALKAAKPPGSRGGWTKKKCICCHKCPNDRSAPNGFVCTNPSHLYWGTKADNTYDQNRGNGWAARNKKQNEGDPNGEKAFAHELMISEDKVRNLIRKILKEDAESESWFGKSFVDFKKAANSGKDSLKYAKDNLIEIGRGSTRVVFDLPDNPGYVLKIINTEVEKTDQTFIDARGNIMPDIGPEGDRRTKHGFFKSHMRQSNQWEADLVMQQKYPNVFPKTFEYADDFSWILAEKAKTMSIGQNDIDNLFNLLGIKRSNFDKQKPREQKKRELLNLINDAMQYFKNPDHRLRKLNEAPPTFSVTDLMEPGDAFLKDENSTQFIDNNSFGKSISKEDQQLKDLISDSHNRQVISAMLDLNIPVREFLPKNLGISEITGKLLIIDASLWETHKPIRE